MTMNSIEPYWKEHEHEAVAYYLRWAKCWKMVKDWRMLQVGYCVAIENGLKFPKEISNMWRLDGWGERWKVRMVARPREWKQVYYFKNEIPTIHQ